MRRVTRVTRVAAIVAIAATAIALSGCTSGANAPSKSGANGPTITFAKKTPLVFGYSEYDFTSTYFQVYLAGIKNEAAKSGIKIVATDSKSSQQLQISGSADLINQGISALIVSPIQPPALPATIAAAHAAKIPVVIGDVGAVGDYDAYILSENNNGGKLAANYFIKSFEGKPGPHKIGVISLHSGSAVGVERVNGFVDTLKGNADFQIVSTLDGNDTVQGGFSAAQDMLSANPDLAGIYAANDPEAQGAVRAMESANKTLSNFLLVGFNGDPSALDLIKAGKQSATIAQDPYTQGQVCVQTALALLDGKTPNYTDVKTRSILVPVEVVDSANLATFSAARANQK